MGHATHSLGVRRGADYPAALMNAVALVRRLRPAILHAQLRHASFIGALVGRLCRVPVVLATRTYTTRLGGHAFLDRWTSRMVDLTVAVSSAARDVVLSQDGVAPERVRLIRNGVDLDEFQRPSDAVVDDRRRALGLLGVPVVGTLGNLHPIKGHEYLVRAAARVRRDVPAVKFLFVGDGPSRRMLADLAASEGVDDCCVFAGFRDDVPALLRLMDVFVLPSLNEGMSHALLEAMALERPVVATGVGGNVEVVDPGRTGLLVPSRDAGALASGILSLLSDPGHARQLARAGRESVEQRFSTTRMVAEYADVYETLAARAGAVAV